MHYRQTPARRAFILFNYCFTILVALLCLLPLVHILAISFSSKNAILSGRITVYPLEFTLNNYRYVIDDSLFFRSFGISVARVILGLAVQMLLTILAAYPLSMSRHKFSARQFYVWFFMITILFSGGLVPSYLVVSKTGLIDSIWSLIIPGAVPVFNVVLLQNFMKALPAELSESAEMDGGGHVRVLFQIILPLCRAAIATLVLFVAVGHWNSWFDGMLFINDNLKFPLQTYLRTIVVQMDINMMTDLNSLSREVASTGADTAKIFIAMVPILMVYPFIQRHFVTGIVIGSVKE